jgi:hypothetical protein
LNPGAAKSDTCSSLYADCLHFGPVAARSRCTALMCVPYVSWSGGLAGKDRGIRGDAEGAWNKRPERSGPSKRSLIVETRNSGKGNSEMITEMTHKMKGNIGDHELAWTII